MKKTLFAIAFLLLVFPLVAAENDSLLHFDYQWKGIDGERSCSLDINARLLDYYRNRRGHTAIYYEESGYRVASSYCGFMFSEYDRKAIRALADVLCPSMASEKDKIQEVLLFVQSLRYESDEKSKGMDEYVRFPIETLADGIGDCEDKSILMAALLSEMGIDFILLFPPDHLALGVSCDSVQNAYPFKFEGKEYYYVETTNTHWAIGQIPPEYLSSPVEMAPCVHTPVVVLKENKFESQSISYYAGARCKITLKLVNLGPTRAKHLRVHWKLMEKERRGWTLLGEGDSYLEDLLEGESRTDVVQFDCVIGDRSRLAVTISSNAALDQVMEVNLHPAREKRRW